MSIQTLHDTGSLHQITPRMDGGTYGTAIADTICQGIGDEFAIQYQSNSLDVRFNAGSQAVIGGAFFRIMSLESIQLEANSTIYLCLNIDLSKSSGNTGSIVQRAESGIQTDNLNGSGQPSRDMLIYIITTSSTGVTSVVDRRKIRGDGNSINGYDFVVISEADYEALATKEPNTIYYTFEV